MLPKIWKFMRGYVIIEVTGFSVERFINMATHRNIKIWGVSRSNEDSGAGSFARMSVSVADFRLLKPFARKTKCKIKIAKKIGAPFLVYRYRKRKFLAAGVVFFVAALYFLSSFVWLVEIEGEQRLFETDIAAFLQDSGLASGSWKNNLDIRTLEKQMLVEFPDILWVNIELKGTTAIVRLVETIPEQVIIDRSVPADIIAKKDALIVEIATSAGTPLVKIGDVVSKGDVLVSGQLLIGTADEIKRTEYVHSSAVIKAKVFYKMEFYVPFQYTIKRLSGESKKFFGLTLFNKQIGLNAPDIPYANYDSVAKTHRLYFSPYYPVPFALTTREYREIILEIATRTEEQAKHYANELISSRIISEFDVETDILDKKVEFITEGNFLKAEAYITTLESIGVTAELSQRTTETNDN